MAVSVTVCEIFSVKEWCDLQNRVRVRRNFVKMFDAGKTRMIGLPYGEKNCDMLSRFHPTPGRYGRTDGRRRTDRIANSKSRVSNAR